MRMLRIKVRGRTAVYHCMSRIVGGQPLLDDVGKEHFRKLMWKQAAFCGIDVITYCVMNNHFHVLVRVPESPEAPDPVLLQRVASLYGKASDIYKAVDKEIQQGGRIRPKRRKELLRRMGDISPFMKELKQQFSRWYNKRHERNGTLWAERFKSVLFEDQPGVIGKIAAYIDLNPVRAGLVQDPKNYRFCGFAQAHAGGKTAKPAKAGILSFSRSQNWKTASKEYWQLMMHMAATAGHSKKHVLDPEFIRQTLEEGGELSMPQTLRLNIRYFNDGVAIGTKEFVEDIFIEFRDRFSKKRTSGARPIRGLPLSPLKSLRDLRVVRFR